MASIGICFAAALLALSFGYSVALGAFIAGSLIAESGHEAEISKLVLPVRDMFAAIFFVSVGMLIDPTALTQHWKAVLALTLLQLSARRWWVSGCRCAWRMRSAPRRAWRSTASTHRPATVSSPPYGCMPGS